VRPRRAPAWVGLRALCRRAAALVRATHPQTACSKHRPMEEDQAIEACHHSGAHIDRDREHRPPNRLAVLFIHDNHADHSMIDLPDFIWTVSGIGAWLGVTFARTSPSPRLRGLLQIKFIDAALYCPTVWWSQALDAACIVHTLD